MFVLWAVMQANYVNLYIGLAAAQAGTPFLTVVVALFFSTAFYTLYGLIAGMNGATTGKRLSALAEDEFGSFGGILAGALGSRCLVLLQCHYCVRCSYLA
jgi:hypothetical protein